MIRRGKVLLVEHTKSSKSYYLVPGGGVDYCEDVRSALIREFMEELSIEIEPLDIVHISESISPDSDRHILNIFFMCRYKSGEPLLGNDKRLSGYGFFTADQLDALKIYPLFLKKRLKEIMLSKKKSPVYMGSSWER